VSSFQILFIHYTISNVTENDGTDYLDDLILL